MTVECLGNGGHASRPVESRIFLDLNPKAERQMENIGFKRFFAHFDGCPDVTPVANTIYSHTNRRPSFPNRSSRIPAKKVILKNRPTGNSFDGSDQFYGIPADLAVELKDTDRIMGIYFIELNTLYTCDFTHAWTYSRTPEGLYESRYHDEQKASVAFWNELATAIENFKFENNPRPHKPRIRLLLDDLQIKL